MDAPGGCRELRNELLHGFCSSLNINNVTKLMRNKWAGYVASIREMGNTWSLGRNTWAEPGVDGRMKFK
jgi:hypothetical protein